MIHRQYVAKLTTDGQGAFPDLDIVVRAPGAYTAPVGNAAAYPPGTPLTAPPAGWPAGSNWYYEIRARALRIEALAGSAAFTPRMRLGSYLAIVPLVSTNLPFTIPGVLLSASLTPNPISNVSLGAEIAAFADPAYGPVIRLRNHTGLYPVEGVALYFLVSLGIAENKDEDWSNLGHA